MDLAKCSWNWAQNPVRNETVVERTTATSLGIFVLSLVFLVGLPGNVFVIWSILARARKLSVTTLIILNLAIADGSLVVLTPFIIIYMWLRSWIFGNLMCKVVFYLRHVSVNVSIQLITLMSMRRLVAMVWPHYVSKISGRGRVVKVLVVVWVLDLVASIPSVFFREMRCSSISTIICDVYHSTETHLAVHYTLELVFGFLIPYPIIVVSYICILRKIRHIKFWRRIRSEKLVLIIVVLFCICWLPYHITNMVQVIWALYPAGSTKDTLDSVWLGVRAVTYAVAFFSSCVNPVFYFFAAKSYIRQEGLGFMAHLFEVAAVDLSSRKSPGHQEAKSVTVEDKILDWYSFFHSSANVIHPASTKK